MKKVCKKILKKIKKSVIKELYVNINGTSDRICVDARTREEFILMNFYENNIPVINKETHYILRKCKILAPVLLTYSILKNKKEIDEALMRLSKNKTQALAFACSKGRLRSPSICIYARLKGIDARVVKGGIKKFFSKEVQSKYFKDIRGCKVDNLEYALYEPEKKVLEKI